MAPELAGVAQAPRARIAVTTSSLVAVRKPLLPAPCRTARLKRSPYSVAERISG